MPVVASCVGRATVVLVQLFYQVTNLADFLQKTVDAVQEQR